MKTHAVAAGARLWIASQQAMSTIRRRLADDRGATTLEYVLIAAGLAAVAIALVVVVRGLVQDTANNIPADVNTGTTFGG